MPEKYKMNDEEYQKLYDKFETQWILDSVGAIDRIRDHIADGENWEPPQIRTDLLKLHCLVLWLILISNLDVVSYICYSCENDNITCK